MPTYPTPGVGGSVVKGSNTVGNITQWDGGPEADEADTTPFGASNSYQQNTTTILKWSFKFQGSTDASDTNGQVAMRNGIGQQDTYKFYIDGTHYWSGPGKLKKITDKANAQKGVVTAEYDVVGSGPLTWN